MAKSLTGYIAFDEKRNRWFARIEPTDTETGKSITRKRYRLTKTEARTALRELLNQYESEPEALKSSQKTFADLATEYRKKKLVPAKYVGEKKLAGMRNTAPSETFLKQAEEYFKSKRLSSIRHLDIEAYRLHLANLPTQTNGQRSMASINRPLSTLRAVFSFAVRSGWIKRNPFDGEKLIDKSAENRRDRLPTFGEEIALLGACIGPLARLRPMVIVAADTGLRANEMMSLEINDLDFEQRLIRLRARNAKGNKGREIPMTRRVEIELRQIVNAWTSGPLFGVARFERQWGKVKADAKITNLHYHDMRHAFVSRAILAGVPLTLVLQASGHSANSTEWQRYANLSATHLKGMLKPHGDQSDAEVRTYARDVLLGLRDALGYSEIEKLLE